ncbi:Cell division protein FtsI [Peptidoglycan synthetase] [hydrothermal vent metagenome]|uniref:Cell division protein FtsI [Peptidoglycan synthetase] n=1 Tax=hydrothermal vent metagenome TaxID=652676 RepID=A0A1W1BBE9_9ZZZZ
MNKHIKNQAIRNRTNKISFLYILIVVAIGIFLFSILKTITSDRHVPSNTITIHDRSFRGSIISADGYTLADSEKTYQAVIRGSSISKEKKPLFVKLFSIYSSIPEKEILKKFKNHQGKEIRGNIVLSKTINAHAAMQLKSLSYKLRKLNVFHSIKNRNGIEIIYGLDIIENGENRRFPLHDVLSPILGYVGDKSDGRYIRPSGKKGLERAYEKHITSKKNGYSKGKRDVVGAIIHDKNFIHRPRIDGMDLHLNIPLSLQRRVELMADQMKYNIDADEILVGIMESKTGKVLSFATSNRYDPDHIRQKDIPALVPKFTEYPYEAGSVMKPITLAIAFNHHVVTPNSWFNTGYHKFQIGKRRYISDDDFFESQNATDIIVHSSNIGISQIAWRLTGEQYRNGLLKFGIAKPSGVDLSRDLPGSLKPLKLLNNKMHRANSSYGYGMMVTFAQLFKAYSAFNNEGLAVTPRLVDYLQDNQGKHYKLPAKIGNSQAISKKAANQIHDILLEVVKRGTGVKAQYPGLEVGGKTGTAHIAKHGHYIKEYHSSFYGFANDKKGHKYTIGVLVIRAKKYHKYFASQSAVPTFRRVLDILVELDYLKPEGQIKPSPKIIAEKIKPIKIQKPIQKPQASAKKFKQKKALSLPKRTSHTKEIKIKSKKKSHHQHVEDLF